MEWLAFIQRNLHSNALAALQRVPEVGLSGLPSLIAAAFLFGLLHALLPGHGKALLTARYAGSGKLVGAIGSSVIVILTHVGAAILLVLTGAAILRKTLVGAGRAPELERLSSALIILIGLWLLLRAVRPQGHPAPTSGPVLAFVGGLVPCPLTTFIMSYAVVNGLVGAGLVLSGAFAAGMIVTVAVFPVLAVILRIQSFARLSGMGTALQRFRPAVEITAAIAIVLIGLWPLLGR